MVGVGEVIAGWDEGIPGMRVGGERWSVPPELTYESRGVANAIPPNSTLTLTVTLLAVQ